MEIRVTGLIIDSDVTLSKVTVDGQFVCFAIEDPLRDTKIKGKTAIPNGKYKVGLRWSPKFSSEFNHEMLWIKDVPNFEYILIHWGNTVDDTDGCLLLGSKVGVLNNKIAVLNSRATYQNLYRMVIAAAKKGDLEIIFER